MLFDSTVSRLRPLICFFDIFNNKFLQNPGITANNYASKDFRIQRTSKLVNPPKSPLQKFDSKTILSLLIGERK